MTPLGAVCDMQYWSFGIYFGVIAALVIGFVIDCSRNPEQRIGLRLLGSLFWPLILIYMIVYVVTHRRR